MREIDPHQAVDFLYNAAPQYAEAKGQRVQLPIPGWPEYEIDQDGNVFRVAPAMGTAPGKSVKWQVLKHGYAKVSLCRNSKRREYLVHRLVAMTFIGDPAGMDVCHFDGDKLNNSVENLRIDTRKGNMADQIRMSKTPRGEKSGSNKYSEALIRVVKQRLQRGDKPREVGNDAGIPVGTIYNIRRGVIWGWL